MSSAPKVVTVSLRTPGGEVPFTLFDTPLRHQVTRAIVGGYTYPRVNFLRDVRTIIDVGANVGAASLFFALNYPAARLLAFEPCPDVYPLLRRNLAPFAQVQTFAFGLLDRDGKVPLYLSADDPGGNSLGRSDMHTGPFVEVALRDARAVLAEQQVAAIDILKIDTEGCEVPILRSLADLVPRTRVLYVEYHDEDDRLAIDALLRGTHVLYRGRVSCPHRGELCYIARDSFPSPEVLNRGRIRGVPGSAGASG